MMNNEILLSATTEPATSNAGYWCKEYEQGGIPSSVREDPSGSVVKFAEFARNHGIQTGNAIDIGCGGGRNSIYLASLGYRVSAIDFVSSSIETLNQKAQALNLEVTGICQDVRQPWSRSEGVFVLGIDAFCFKHQIAREDVAAYIDNASSALAPGGLLMISFAGRQDSYYAQFETSYQDRLGVIIRDPGNQILSRLYDPAEVIDQFGAFEAIKEMTKTTVNEMHDKRYKRETHIVYMRRRE